MFHSRPHFLYSVYQNVGINPYQFRNPEDYGQIDNFLRNDANSNARANIVA